MLEAHNEAKFSTSAPPLAGLCHIRASWHRTAILPTVCPSGRQNPPPVTPRSAVHLPVLHCRPPPLSDFLAASPVQPSPRPDPGRPLAQ
ncbi:unnamed protein product [Trichobilharzia regenti]|nr:unnamed protein product [Trichobilharzia regenti]